MTTTKINSAIALCLLIVFQTSFGQKDISKTEKTAQNKTISIPKFIKFEGSKQVTSDQFLDQLKEEYQLQNSTFQLINEITDPNGTVHQKYKQYVAGKEVVTSMLRLHLKNEKVYLMNGNIFHIPTSQSTIKVSFGEKNSLKTAEALLHVKAYLPTYENPEGRLVWCPLPEDPNKFELAWEFDIYSYKPLGRSDVYVSAISGEAIKNIQTICHSRSCSHDHTASYESQVSATGNTRYSGVRTFDTEFNSAIGQYVLQDGSRGTRVETYNMRQGTTYGSAVDFTDADNNWTSTTNDDDIALDAHWGSQMTFDFFMEKFSRDSYDGNGAPVLSYVHYDVGFDNAFWDGERMTYGDGSGTIDGFNPLTALDVVGHELTHGVTEYSAGLIYQGESGALNECMSDIFGTAIEFYARPENANWQVGEDVRVNGTPLRYMSDPNAVNDPDTYLGQYWDDIQQSVHQNSPVGSYWFYLTTEGGSGINDNNVSYNVQGIGMDKSLRIAYHALTNYFTPTTDYAEARTLTIQSAVDLYGACSPEVEAVGDAWYAVGVGIPYIAEAVASFTGDEYGCEVPSVLQFNSTSTNAENYLWNFGDGNTSREANPIHTYTRAGTFSVSLEISGGCGTATETKPNFVLIETDGECPFNMGTTGTQTSLSCSGTLFDDGGEDGSYSNNVNTTFIINPPDASNITLNFEEFLLESGFDYFSIYDGTSANANIIGSYTSNQLDGEVITTDGGAVTLVFDTDGSVTNSGFKIDWQCLSSDQPPIANFDDTPIASCDGQISLQSTSLGSIDSYNWNFGDGSTSNQADPSHTYTSSGNYTISLTVCNSNGCNTKTLANHASVDLETECEVLLPLSGIGVRQNSCIGRLLDPGGESNYQNNINGHIVIDPAEPTTRIALNFETFSFESGWDYLYIFEGDGINSNDYEVYSGVELAGSTLTIDSDIVTIRMTTDGSVTRSGFDMTWRCIPLVGLDEHAESLAPSLYPNPANDLLSVTNPVDFDGVLKIISLNGRELYQGTIDGSEQKTIDVSTFNEGMYLVQIVADQNIMNAKLLIE